MIFRHCFPRKGALFRIQPSQSPCKWKLQGAQPVRYGLKSLFVAPDGAEIRVDISTGKVVESGGDLILTLKYDLQPVGSLAKVPYNWSASITIVDGGLMEAKQRIENMMQAPEGDYQSSLTVNMLATRPKWSNGSAMNFYAKFRGSQFAKLQFNIQCTPQQAKGYVQALWWVNPTGSRSLEYDEDMWGNPKSNANPR